MSHTSHDKYLSFDSVFLKKISSQIRRSSVWVNLAFHPSDHIDCKNSNILNDNASKLGKYVHIVMENKIYN
jgi:hypothetical protein